MEISPLFKVCVMSKNNITSHQKIDPISPILVFFYEGFIDVLARNLLQFYFTEAPFIQYIVM